MKETDYRYIMENMSVLQIGAKYSYRELVDDIDLSYKYRCIIKQLLLQEVDADTTIESHLYYMKPQDESCRIYRQLRAKIRIYVPKVKKHLGGRTDTEFEERVLTAEELTSISPEQKTLMGMMISELQLSKMGLMTFVI